MTHECEVAMRTEKGNAMIVRFPGKIVQFLQLDNRLFGLDPNEKTSHIAREEDEQNKCNNCMPGNKTRNRNSKRFNNLHQFLLTIKINHKSLSEEDIDRSKKMQKEFQVLGTSEAQGHKEATRMNLMKDDKDTAKSIASAQKDFGRCSGNLNGKVVRNNTEAFRDVNVEIPKDVLSAN